MSSKSHLSKAISYCPDTGVLTWKERPRQHFKRKRTWLATNARYAGKPAGSLGAKGYLYVRIDQIDHAAHRIAWLLTYGAWPDFIDHINGEKADNRMVNLREVSVAENQKNLPMPKNNTSGFVGVTFATNRWMAQIQVGGKRIYLGRFVAMADAITARKQANLKYGFHENHGRVM